MKSTLLIFSEILLILAGLGLYSLGYLPVPILPLVLVAWASLRIRHLRWRDVGLKKPVSWLKTIGLALLVGIGYQVLDILLISPVLEKLTGKSVDLSQFSDLKGNLPLLIISLFVSWTLAGFIEELFFRGYMLNRIQDIAGRERFGIAISLVGNALVFGTAHAYQGITGVVDTTIAGLVLGGLYVFASRNLWLPIFAHGTIDTVGFLLIFVGLYG